MISTLQQVVSHLKNVKNNYIDRKTFECTSVLSSEKRQAILENNQEMAKIIWCYEQILSVQNNYIDAFNHIKAKDFYTGWQLLEQAEINLLFLSKHFDDINDEFSLQFIDEYIGKYQEVYPYKLFMSPEILEKEKKCSVCGKIIDLKNPCGHRVGEIYDGEMCSRVVTDMEFLGMAIVKNPVQKYSVIFLEDGDQYDYSLVEFVADRLRSPFHKWDYKVSRKQHPHLGYPNVKRNSKCPCGSGKKNKNCHMVEANMLRPHYTITFDVPPPKHLMNDIVYTTKKKP